MLVTFLQKRGQELDFAMQAFGVPRVSDSPTAVMGTRGGVCGARTHVPPGVWEGEHGEKRKLPSVMSRDGAVRDVMQMALLLSLSKKKVMQLRVLDGCLCARCDRSHYAPLPLNDNSAAVQ